MIRFDHVSFRYATAEISTLRDVDLEIPDGELVLVIGRTGAGKSTLLRAINGLAPHFTGGTLTGRVSVDGRDTRHNPPRELADVVGYVGQDPLSGFVTESVEEELAYAMESLGFDPAVMRQRVEETLDLLGLSSLRDRPAEFRTARRRPCRLCRASGPTSRPAPRQAGPARCGQQLNRSSRCSAPPRVSRGRSRGAA